MSVAINAITSVPGFGNKVAAIDGLIIAVGTTAQRLLGNPGSLRFNNTTNVFEGTPDGINYYTFLSSSGSILSITGTPNRINVSSGSNPTVDISATYVGQSSITTVGALSSGSLASGFSPITPQLGGTGVVNTGTLTLGGNTSFSGAFTFSGTLTANTAITFPTAGTLATTSQLPTLPLSFSNGGTGAALTPSNGGIFYSTSTTAAILSPVNSASLVTSNAGIPSLVPMTNGQLIIGNTGATPTAATLTVGSGLSISNGAGSINISSLGTLRSFQILTSGIGATYTTPSNVTKILVECVGGGGAGGGAISTTGTTTSAAAGGGAGAYCRKLFNPAAGTYNYNIGTAGVPGAAGNNKGGDGGDTVFGTLNAGGGNGGNGCPESSSSQISGSPGSGGISTGGDINIQGQDGNYGFTSLVAYAISGNGGSNLLGAGGAQVASTNLGKSGVAANANTGCGGSGGVVANATTSVGGGSGGSGEVIVWEFA
jgi:hypothetical protein